MPTNPNVKLFLAYAQETFKAKSGDTLFINWGKDSKFTKELLEPYDLDRLKSLWKLFLTLENDWHVQNNGFTISGFKYRINMLILLRKKAMPSKIKNEYKSLSEPEGGRVDPSEVKNLIKGVADKLGKR